MPGLVNTHTHLGATILRGISDDVDGIAWMPLNWSVMKHITKDDLYLAALTGIAEMIACGTTCFSDTYQDIEQTARAVAETGIRAELAAGLTERNGQRDARRLLEEARAFVSGWHGKADGRIHARLGPTPSIPAPRTTCLPASCGWMHGHACIWQVSLGWKW
jgi:5-methylthioadenosine/S-adenosylhomocysteine deaminase